LVAEYPEIRLFSVFALVKLAAGLSEDQKTAFQGGLHRKRPQNVKMGSVRTEDESRSLPENHPLVI
jgi:hypothetical protein